MDGKKAYNKSAPKLRKGLPKCLSLSSQMFRDTGSRRLRIAKTTINSTAMPIVNNVPVNKAANGKIDKPSPPSIDPTRKTENTHTHYSMELYRLF